MTLKSNPGNFFEDFAVGDELIHALRCPGQERAHGERRQAQEEQSPGAERVGQPAGQRHRRDVDEEVAVDDPGGLPELAPVGQVDHDRRQRDRCDHQLEAGQEHPDPEHGQDDERRAAIHGRSVAGQCPPAVATDLAVETARIKSALGLEECYRDINVAKYGLENVLCPDFEFLTGLSTLGLMAGSVPSWTS